MLEFWYLTGIDKMRFGLEINCQVEQVVPRPIGKLLSLIKKTRDPLEIQHPKFENRRLGS